MASGLCVGAEHTALGSVSGWNVRGKMLCTRSVAEPSFGQHEAVVVGALLTPECEGGWANKASAWVFPHL